MNNIETGSFRDAILYFLSNVDDEFPVESLSSLVGLEKSGDDKYSYNNRVTTYNGNHDMMGSTVSIYLITKPLEFYVVEVDEWDTKNHTTNTVTRRIFIPKA